MKKRVGFVCVALLVLTAFVAYAQEPFPDVKTDHWAYGAVTKLQEEGIVVGYPDGYFRGSHSLSRYEFAQALLRALEYLERIAAAPSEGLEARVKALEAAPRGGAGLTAEQQRLLQRLEQEFAPELKALRADYEALAKRVSALEAWRSKVGEWCPAAPSVSAPAPRPAARLAYPTLGGPTGGAVLPDAMVVPAGRLALAADWTKINLFNEASTISTYYGDVLISESEDLTLIPVRLVYGIGSRAELWGAYTKGDLNGRGRATLDGELVASSSVDGDIDTWGFGAKYQLLREPQDSVTLAIGAGYEKANLDITATLAMYGELPEVESTSADETVTTAYLVATKNLSSAGNGTRVLGSLGVMWKDFKEMDENLFEPFVGLEFVGGSGTSLGLEYRFKDKDVDSEGLFSAVLRHPFTENLALQVGVTNGAMWGLGGEDYDLFAGLNFTFGGSGGGD